MNQWNSGTTGTVCLLMNWVIYTGWLGDSQACLVFTPGQLESPHAVFSDLSAWTSNDYKKSVSLWPNSAHSSLQVTEPIATVTTAAVEEAGSPLLPVTSLNSVNINGNIWPFDDESELLKQPGLEIYWLYYFSLTRMTFH
ncbi:unnamed protein product [Protopolystoma xenopodis]|uniref:PPM-type phosphatase domain-containing protein n=1 Tax=Protopolystoma xenopodis TaxID=117903 RepID=A0A3S5FDI3_9PLAT|nr:unnamed protein product [Protopolystoma xenopodis]